MALIDEFWLWIQTYLTQIIIIAATIIVGYLVYKIVKRNLNKYVRLEKIDAQIAKYILISIKIVIYIILFAIIFSQFAESIGYLTGMLGVVFGTVIGFASMNTVGNIIAGLIIFISKPFKVGYRIKFKGEPADVTEITLIYTILKDLDERKIYIPNQKLLTEEIITLGKEDISRRHIKVTLGYDLDRKEVENALLEATTKISEVLIDPKPYVWITSFLDYAVEYSLFIYITDIKHFPRIESDLYKAVFDVCTEKNFEIAVPLMGNLKVESINPLEDRRQNP